MVERTGSQRDDFRRQLPAAIDDDAEWPYWESWVVAVDRLIEDSGPLR